jgi:TolB-like protein/DNA-binding winged helix-turn-helix (wHTH) protein/Tfp pilus assembly protein PilF
MRVAFGEYELDTKTQTLQREGRRIPVQSKAFDLLAYLIEHRDQVVSSDELLDTLWPGLHVTPAALSTAVQKARQAVGDDGEHQAVLRTEHGKGFRFVAEVTDLSTPEAAPATLTHSWTRLAFATGVAVVLLAVVVTWFLNQPVAESAPPRSVAVLPFANISQDAAAEPLTNGIYDDILTHLSKVRDLKVIARTSMERLDPSLSVQEIGSKLGVAAVLEGGVQWAGDSIRINVQLIDCKTEAHLWADTYDRELTAGNIFAIQSEIATAVAGALRATLSPEEQGQLATVPTENLAAYQAYLLGRQRFSELADAPMEEAIEYFQQAIEFDPKFALAYVGLADSYILRVYWGVAPLAETLAKAQAAAEMALALNDRLGEAYNSLAGIKEEAGDFVGAEATYRRALELNPNYALTYHWYGVLLLNKLGRPEEALTLFLRAVELDPLSGIIVLNMGSALNSLGRFEEALAWYERSLELDPTLSDGFAAIGSYHRSVTGKLDQAVVWYRRAIALDPSHSGYPAWLASTLLDLGDPVAAAYWIDRAVELGPDRDWPRTIAQQLHLYRNDERAVLAAREAFSNGAFNSPYLTLLREHYLNAGRYAEARALFEEANPEFLREDKPDAGCQNYAWGHDLAAMLLKTGERERADLLLDKSWQCIQNRPRRGEYGYGIADVQILALRGETQKALSALRQAIKGGWRSGWWFCERDPNLESLHGEPEFQAMLEEVRADMAQQLVRVREMEQKGELAAIPRDETNPH